MPTTAADGSYPNSERLDYRPIALSDGPDVYEACKEWEVVKFTASIPHPYPPGEEIAFIERSRESWTDGSFLLFIARRKDDGGYVGQVSLTLDEGRREAELGYLVCLPEWGRGYASEMALAIVAYGFETVGLDRIFARVSPDNTASNKIMPKLNMEYRSTGMSYAPARGRENEVHWYDCRAEDWMKRTA